VHDLHENIRFCQQSTAYSMPISPRRREREARGKLAAKAELTADGR
jgi:hypothetical protein